MEILNVRGKIEPSILLQKQTRLSFNGEVKSNYVKSFKKAFFTVNISSLYFHFLRFTSHLRHELRTQAILCHF